MLFFRQSHHGHLWQNFIDFFHSKEDLRPLVSSLFESWFCHLTPEDILQEEKFQQYRPQIAHYLLPLKKAYTLDLGPHMTIFLEHKIFVWWQVQEMLRIEKGGPDQIQEELDTYNPLIPQKNTSMVTWMLNFPDVHHRGSMLQKLQGIQNHLVLHLGAYHKKTHEKHCWDIPFHECPYYLGGQHPRDDEPAHTVYFMMATLPSLEDYGLENVSIECTHPLLREEGFIVHKS